jgi:hypothetical protein
MEKDHAGRKREQQFEFLTVAAVCRVCAFSKGYTVQARAGRADET